MPLKPKPIGRPVEAPDAAPRMVCDSYVMDKAWRSLLEQTIPSETHEDLVKTFKRFFYAGAKSLIETLVYTDALEDDENPTPNDLMKIDAILHEINVYFGEVAAGRQ